MKQTKLIAKQDEWNRVSSELEAENIKLMSYDKTLFSLCGDVTGKRILDYGAGPGILASALKKSGGEIMVWDINPDMREKASKKIGSNNVFGNIDEIPSSNFDVIICNLVLCIVSEEEVRNILTNIKSFLNDTGTALIGFCNPKIFYVVEPNLDFRFPTGNNYRDNHEYKKIKKEGEYEIIETHRPIEWYKKIFAESGLKLTQTNFTPQYELKDRKIEDFVILARTPKFA